MIYVIMAKSNYEEPAFGKNWFKAAVSHERKLANIDSKILRSAGFRVAVVETNDGTHVKNSDELICLQ